MPLHLKLRTDVIPQPQLLHTCPAPSHTYLPSTCSGSAGPPVLLELTKPRLTSRPLCLLLLASDLGLRRLCACLPAKCHPPALLWLCGLFQFLPFWTCHHLSFSSLYLVCVLFSIFTILPTMVGSSRTGTCPACSQPNRQLPAEGLTLVNNQSQMKEGKKESPRGREDECYFWGLQMGAQAPGSEGLPGSLCGFVCAAGWRGGLEAFQWPSQPGSQQ